MENPFKKLIEDNKKNIIIKEPLNENFQTGFYCNKDHGTIVFIEKAEESSEIVWRTSLGSVEIPNEILCDNFMKISKVEIDRNENFKLDLKFIIMNDAYPAFEKFFSDRGEFEILTHINKIQKEL